MTWQRIWLYSKYNGNLRRWVECYDVGEVWGVFRVGQGRLQVSVSSESSVLNKWFVIPSE